MRARLLLALAAGFMIGAADPAPDLGEVESQEIPVGSKWVLVFPPYKDTRESVVDEFRPDGSWWRNNNPSWSSLFKYSVDAVPCPPQIDLIIAPTKERRRGIYRLDGDRLLICMGKWGTDNRPTTFAHRPKAGWDFWIYKRLK